MTRTEIINKMDSYINVVAIAGAVLAAIAGVPLLYFSLERKEDTEGLLFLVGAYVLFLVAGALFSAGVNSKKNKFGDVSWNSFFVYGLFLPFGFWAGIYMIYQHFGSFSSEIMLKLIYVVQIITIAAWFGDKLFLKKYHEEKNLMKLDMYSTIVVGILTIVWVLYKIDEIKYFFATILGEFLAIQIIVKHYLIQLTSDPVKEEWKHDM